MPTEVNVTELLKLNEILSKAIIDSQEVLIEYFNPEGTLYANQACHKLKEILLADNENLIKVMKEAGLIKVIKEADL